MRMKLMPIKMFFFSVVNKILEMCCKSRNAVVIYRLIINILGMGLEFYLILENKKIVLST